MGIGGLGGWGLGVSYTIIHCSYPGTKSLASYNSMTALPKPCGNPLAGLFAYNVVPRSGKTRGILDEAMN